MASKKTAKGPVKSKDEGVPWVPLALGAGLVYLGFQWLKGSTPTLQAPVSRPISTTPTAQPQSLASLLCTSAQARAIFNFQALLYEFGYTSAIPDGIMGPITQGLIAQVNNDTGNGSSTSWNSGLLQEAHLAVLAANGANAQPTQALPMSLPVDVIHLLNQDALAADPNAILIQVSNSTAAACS